MRFRLSTLLAAAVLLPPLVALVYFQGSFGIVVAMPHAIALLVVVWLARRRRWAIATACAAVYLGCWGVTTLIGVPAASEHLRKHLRNEILSSDANVGNASIPCPFLVILDYRYMKTRTRAFGGEAGYVWFFGYLDHLGTRNEHSIDDRELEHGRHSN